MTYIEFGDLRPGTSAEFAAGLEIDDSVVGDDDILTDAIARLSERFDKATNDHFESDEGLVLTLHGDGTSRLALPKRCTEVDTVEVVSYAGASTTQDVSVYRLRSSLDADGVDIVAPGATDWIEVVPTKYLSGGYFGCGWPTEANSVIVTGTFGWLAVPADVKRAVALMVYAEFAPQADILGLVNQWSDQGTTYQRSTGPTGIPVVDQIIATYQYGTTTTAQVLIG